jgi:hypothetical protein
VSPHLRHAFQPDGLLLIWTIGVDRTIFEVNPFPGHLDLVPVHCSGIHKLRDLPVEFVGYRERDLVADNFAVRDRRTFVIAVHRAGERVAGLNEAERKILRIPILVFQVAGPDAGEISGRQSTRKCANKQQPQKTPSL